MPSAAAPATFQPIQESHYSADFIYFRDNILGGHDRFVGNHHIEFTDFGIGILNSNSTVRKVLVREGYSSSYQFYC